MIALKVSKNEALIALEHFPHQRFRNGIRRYWKVDADGAVDGRSVCWLYCWAKTGMGSQNASEEAQRAFYEIFDVSFDRFDAKVNHEWARQARYARDRGPVDAELARLLG